MSRRHAMYDAAGRAKRAEIAASQATIAAAAVNKDLLLICRFKEPSAAEEFVDDVEKAFPKISADYENRLTVSLVLENPSSSDASKIQTMARKYDGLVKRIGK